MKNQSLLTVVFLLVAGAGTASAQLMSAAPTWGKGQTGVLVSSNMLLSAGVPNVNFSFAQVIHGVSDRVDAIAGVGMFSTLGQRQAHAVFGGNVNLYKSRKLSVSTVQVAGVPLNNRNLPSAVWWYPTGVASTEFHSGHTKIEPYGGYTVTVPLGKVKKESGEEGGYAAKEHSLLPEFTCPDTVQNIPIGAAITRGRVTMYAEYDLPGAGRTKIHAAGIGFFVRLTKSHHAE